VLKQTITMNSVVPRSDDSAPMRARSGNGHREQITHSDAIASECYERAILDLDRTLLADAQRHDQTRARRMIQRAVAESLNRRPEASPAGTTASRATTAGATRASRSVPSASTRE
jgi:hypothetical protein